MIELANRPSETVVNSRNWPSGLGCSASKAKPPPEIREPLTLP
jgi:hypothetical protein